MLKTTHRSSGELAAQATPLPLGWTEHIAPTGHPYYYNAETKQSTYTRPVIPLYPQSPAYTRVPFASPYLTNAPPQNNHWYPNDHLPRQHEHARGRGRYRGGHGYQDQRRREHLQDRPKSKHAIPGCSPWVLVKTKLGRRFVHNPETQESYWEFPKEVIGGVVEYDIQERKKRERRERGGTSEVEDEEAIEAEEVAAADRVNPGASSSPTPQVEHGSSDEYEEVEVTDDDSEEDSENPAKRQRLDDDPPHDQPIDFNEDDIAYQLAAMGQAHGLDPGEYGVGTEGAEEWEEGAEGLPLTEEDTTALFRDMLDDHQISPYTPWETLIDEGRIVEDERYTVLPSTRDRKDVWAAWSKDRIALLKMQREKQEKLDPRIPYLAFLHQFATPKLYWPEFKRKYRKEAVMKDVKLTDKEKEKLYREHVNRLKLAQPTLKSDLSLLLRSISLIELNKGSSLAALPSQILTDLRYISLTPQTRDPLIEAYISTLPPAPEMTEVSTEESEQAARERAERERREKAMRGREARVQEEKRRQRKDLEMGRGVLRAEEEEVERAMRVGKEGLKAQLGGFGEERDGGEHAGGEE